MYVTDFHVKPQSHCCSCLIFALFFQGNVEIETYWLKGKRDKDGNAQAACPQFETQTISKAISKATISGPEDTGDEEGLVIRTQLYPGTINMIPLLHCSHGCESLIS